MKIGVKQVDFLGATIGDSKIKLQPHIIKKIVEFQDSKLNDTKGLRSFLGILNYARSYIPDLGKTLGPLYSKVSPTGEKHMNNQDWKLVQKVKQQVQALPEMVLPPADATITLETDGCMEGWGGICKWKIPGEPRTKERVCAYASGRFLPIKSTIDAEIQAVINSLDKFKIYYLDKKELTIRTDCQAIVSFYAKIAQNKPSRVRWLTFSDFITGLGISVTFEHIDGKDNTLADTLSRLVIMFLQEERFTSSIQQVLPLIQPKEEGLLMMREMPALYCGCRRPAKISISRTSQNPDRYYFTCEQNACHSWWWQDLVDDYLEAAQQRREESEQDGLIRFRRIHESITTPEAQNMANLAEAYDQANGLILAQYNKAHKALQHLQQMLSTQYSTCQHECSRDNYASSCIGALRITKNGIQGVLAHLERDVIKRGLTYTGA